MSLLKNKLFHACVTVPTLVASVYFGLIASDVYISESRFIVRTAEKQAFSGLGAILKGSGFVRSQDDAYTVQDYIHSRDVMALLDEKLRIKEKFSAPEIDFVKRFAGLDWDKSNEAFYQYFIDMVGIKLDPASSIITLHTKAFNAEDSLAINQNLLQMSEQLINKMNERARQDMIRFAQREVEDAEKKAKTTALGLAEYQNTVGLIDPEKQSALPLQKVAKLQDEMLVARSQILQIEALAPQNPQLPILHKHVALLEKEIDKESEKVTSNSDKSLASKAVQFHRLALDKEFADRQLASTLASLEQAKAEAQRKQLYLEHVVQPNTPDQAREPKRLRNILSAVVIGFILWGVFSVVIGGIREHHER